MTAHARKNRGFTLIETLIVVGVVAVLVALSLPLFLNAIEKAHIAADEAYERAAMACASSLYAAGKIDTTDTTNVMNMFVYDAEHDAVIENFKDTTNATYGKCRTHKGCYLWVAIQDDGTIYLLWASDKGSFNINSTVPHHTDKTFPG